MYKFSQGLQKNIEEWEVERRKLILEEQEVIKNTKIFFEQSNQLLEFCKDCHKAFLKGNAEQKRKIVKIVCSNFSYDGSNIVIEPNPIFKAVIKNSLCNKKLPEPSLNRTFIERFYNSIIAISCEVICRIDGVLECA